MNHLGLLYAYEKPLTTENFEKRQGGIDELRRHIPEKQFMLLGDVGTGKTTTLKYLTLIDAEQCLKEPTQHNIPLYFELRHFTGDRSLREQLIAELPFTADFSTELLERGKINVFLDGLNEVAQQRRKQVINEIQSLIQRYPQMPLIIAGRQLHPFYIKCGANISVFEYGKMTAEQVKEFIAKNTEDSDETTRQLIQNAIDTQPIIAKLVKVPFILFLMIQVVQRTHAIPQNNVTLLDEFMELLYQREESKDADFNKDAFKILISALALYITEKFDANSAISQKKALNFLSQQKDKYGLDVDLLRILDIGVQLSILSRHKDEYSFVHGEFLGYYAELSDERG